MELLSVKNLSISFGGLKAVDNFNISIEKGQLYGLIGPNGAGKTTVFNLLTGVYQPDSGSHCPGWGEPGGQGTGRYLQERCCQNLPEHPSVFQAFCAG